MSMDKGHNGRYVYTTIHRRLTIKPVIRAMVTLLGKENGHLYRYMKYIVWKK